MYYLHLVIDYINMPIFSGMIFSINYMFNIEYWTAFALWH